MREVVPDPSGHRFLLKALSEAGNELADELYSCPSRLLDAADADGWTPRTIAAHVAAFEEMTADAVERILRRRRADLDVVDTEAARDDPNLGTIDIERCVTTFAHLRRSLQYTLWDLHDRHWQRTGVHPYRGEVTVDQLLRELHLHDLEFLWRVRRIVEAARPGR